MLNISCPEVEEPASEHKNNHGRPNDSHILSPKVTNTVTPIIHLFLDYIQYLLIMPLQRCSACHCTVSDVDSEQIRLRPRLISLPLHQALDGQYTTKMDVSAIPIMTRLGKM